MKKKTIVIAAAGVAAVLCVGCLALALLTDTTPAPEATATTVAEATAPSAPTDTPPPTDTPAPTPTPETFVTMDGYDPASDSIIDPINLWIDYDDRSAGIAAKAKHGDKVKLVQREGDGVLVETADGVQGWVTYYFIKEFK
jgi:hypothetical protein